MARDIAQYLTCLALALLPSCVSPPPPDVEVVPGPVPSVELAVKQTPEPCGLAFSPAPELHDAAVTAAARWSAATGCDVRVGAGGLPIVAWPILFVEYTSGGQTLLADSNVGGKMRSICGLATWNDGDTEVVRLDISLACDVEDAVTHEIGHALARLKRHSFTGVMASGENEDRTHVIDAASLELVCYSLPCASFEPES